MSDSHSGRILRLRIEDFKGIDVAEVNTHGADVVTVSGRNGVGKSSTLDAIVAVLGGTRVIDPRPVRDGEETACVEATFTDGLQLRRVWTKGGTASSLRVTLADGTVAANGQNWLNERVNAAAFDPLAWTRRAPKDQFSQLCELVGLDLSGLVRDRAATYAERTQVNRELDAAKARFVAADGDFAGVPDEPVSLTKLNADLSAARRADDDYRRLRESVDRNREEATRLETQIAELQNRLRLHRTAEQRDAAAAEHLSDTLPDVAAIEGAMEQAEATNSRVAEKRRAADLRASVTDLQASSDELSERIDAIDTSRREQLAEAEWPVDGLGVDPEEGSVTYRDRPLRQASQAEQLAVAMGVAGRLNRDVRVILVREASLCDEETLSAMREQAVTLGAQLWLERVGEGGLQITVDDEDGDPLA
ncbi:MAG TPA: hypothetical protein DCQ64_04875 [Candidatus Rokubacteria bacterium]|nr:hypothetical protein [Candidatus Rokubacteria bacterium]